jgi:predicted RNA-binding Zn-ribbon protein involved in translation (DUF1610 family)
MSDRDQGLLKQAILALQAGRTPEARKILIALVQQNPRDVTAWVWLGKAMDDPARRRDCFTRALRLNPGNEEARRGMIALLSGPDATGQEALAEEQAPAEEVLEDEGAPARPPSQITAFPSPCPNCGAQLRYDVSHRALHCAHCGTEKGIPAATYLVEWLGMPPDLSGPEAQGELIRRETLRCRSCGAATELSSRTASLTCPYCGSPQVARSKGQVYLVPPRALIPFAVDEESAQRHLREWLAEGYWHPDDLAKKAELVDMQGTYLPFWGFKGLAEVTYQLQGSGMLLESLPMAPSQQTQHINVQDLLIPGSFSLGEHTLRAIEPFDLDQAVPFHPEYLAGWPAEVYQVALADATIEARGRMSKEARNKADAMTPVLNLEIEEADFGGLPIQIRGMGSRQRNRQVTYAPTLSTIRLDSFMHYVLPVWVGTYRYHGRTYSFAVNGQTGKAGGEAPRGGTAGILSIVLGAVIVALVGLFLWRFWPAIAGLFRGLFQSTPSSGTATGLPASTIYLGTAIMAVVVFVLFGVVSQWKKISTWFKGERDDPQL